MLPNSQYYGAPLGSVLNFVTKGTTFARLDSDCCLLGSSAQDTKLVRIARITEVSLSTSYTLVTFCYQCMKVLPHHHAGRVTIVVCNAAEKNAIGGLLCLGLAWRVDSTCSPSLSSSAGRS